MNGRRQGLLVAVATAMTVGILSGALLWAAPVSPDLAGIAERHKLSRPAVEEITRAYRGAVAVGVNAKRLEALIQQALAAGMQPRDVVRATAVVATAAVDGLPSAPLLNRFGEGLAKDVRGGDIIGAMERRAISLKRARRLVSDLIFERESLENLEVLVVAVASALERGAREGDIDEVFRQNAPDTKKIVLAIEKLP